MVDIRAINQPEGPFPFRVNPFPMNQFGWPGPWGRPSAEEHSNHRQRSRHGHDGEEHSRRHGREEAHEHEHDGENEHDNDAKRDTGNSDEDEPVMVPGPDDSVPHHMHRGGRSHRGPHGMGGRGGCRGHRGREHGFGGRHGGPGTRRGPGPFGMPFDIPFGMGSGFGHGPWGAKRRSQGQGDDEAFTPSVDIFDTPSTYIIHVSLPGAFKDNISVGWDEEKSALTLSGVVTRPGDEEFLKTMASGEREVGAFFRNVYLGTASQPARVHADGIRAALENGILSVEVPKNGKEESHVAVKYVDVQ